MLSPYQPLLSGYPADLIFDSLEPFSERCVIDRFATCRHDVRNLLEVHAAIDVKDEKGPLIR